MSMTVYRLRSISNPSKFLYMKKLRASSPSLSWVSEAEGNIFRTTKEANEIASIVSRNMMNVEFINCELITYDLLETGKEHFLKEAVNRGQFKEIKKELTPQVKENKAAMLLKMTQWNRGKFDEMPVGLSWREAAKWKWKQEVSAIILKVIFQLTLKK